MEKYIIIWFIVISLVTATVTVYDKRAAKKHPRHRVPENTLLLLAVLGGSVAELLTMLKIHHKTRHKKFTVGLPVIIFLQVTAAVLVYIYLA